MSTSYEDELSALWLITPSTCARGGMGGGVCFHKSGYVVTTRHVVGELEFGKRIFGRSHGNNNFRELTYVSEFPTLDVAILLVESQPGETFPFKPFNTDSFHLEEGVEVVVHGHAGRIASSALFATTSFPYTSCHDLPTQLQDLSLTMATADENELAEIRKNYPTPPFRTLARVTSIEEQNDLLDFHPHVPVIELDSELEPGFSGCPVFRVCDGELLGIVSFGKTGCEYLIPSDVLRHVTSKAGAMTQHLCEYGLAFCDEYEAFP